MFASQYSIHDATVIGPSAANLRASRRCSRSLTLAMTAPRVAALTCRRFRFEAEPGPMLTQPCHRPSTPRKIDELPFARRPATSLLLEMVKGGARDHGIAVDDGHWGR